MLVHLTSRKKENKEEKSARGNINFLTGRSFLYLLDKSQRVFFVAFVKLKHMKSFIASKNMIALMSKSFVSAFNYSILNFFC